jgi:acetyl-CoA carboxylase/biotin carboxylase 1
MAERPDATLAVVCGAVTKAYPASNACWKEYKRVLENGQVPGRDVLKTVFGVDFIYKSTRYSFAA